MPARYYTSRDHHTELFPDRSVTGPNMRRAVGMSGQQADRGIPPTTLPYSGERWQSVLTDMPQERSGFPESPQVKLLDKNSFAGFIRDMEKAMVMFYNPNSASNAEAAFQFGMAADRPHHHSYAFGAVDCTRHGDLCGVEEASMLPMFKLYSNGYVVSTIVHGKNLTANQMLMMMKMTPVLTQPRVDIGMGKIKRI